MGVLEAQPRLAAELEFDLEYFKVGAPIREYFEVNDLDKITHYDIKNKDLPEIGVVLSRKKMLPLEVEDLLDRFEISWEQGFTPPKVEIRHKGTVTAAIAKSDIKKLLRLFASSETEAEELFKHLSSIRASGKQRPHLNAHIHASDPRGASRVEEMKALQIQTTLEFAQNLDKEAVKRLFTSELSSYSQNMWSRGVGRAIGLSRYESRKRSVPIDQDIDRLNNVMSSQLDSGNAKKDALALVNAEVIEKLLKIPLKPTEMGVKISFFEDLAHLTQESLEGDLLIRTLLSKKVENDFRKMLSVEGLELESVRVLLKLRQLSKGSPSDIKKIDQLLIQNLESLDVYSRRKLLLWISRNFTKTEVDVLAADPNIKEFFFEPVTKDLIRLNLADNYLVSHEHGYHEYLSVNTEALGPQLRALIKAYQKLALLDPNYWDKNRYHLGMGLRENPLELFDYLPTAHVDKLFQHLKARPIDIHPEIEEVIYSLRVRHEKEKSLFFDPTTSVSKSNCMRWLAQ